MNSCNVVPMWLGLRSLHHLLSRRPIYSSCLGKEGGGEGNEHDIPRADFDTAETRSRDARARNADHGVGTALDLALSGAVEEQIGRRPVAEENTHIGSWVEGRIVVVGEGERDVDCSVPIIGAADTVAVVAGAAARGDVPVGS